MNATINQIAIHLANMTANINKISPSEEKTNSNLGYIGLVGIVPIIIGVVICYLQKRKAVNAVNPSNPSEPDLKLRDEIATLRDELATERDIEQKSLQRKVQPDLVIKTPQKSFFSSKYDE